MLYYESFPVISDFCPKPFGQFSVPTDFGLLLYDEEELAFQSYEITIWRGLYQTLVSKHVCSAVPVTELWWYYPPTSNLADVSDDKSFRISPQLFFYFYATIGKGGFLKWQNCKMICKFSLFCLAVNINFCCYTDLQ